MASIDLIIIAIYLIACLIIGLYKVDKINNIREYSLGKSSFPTVILVATIFSTYVSARASIADIGLVYSSGLIYGIPLLYSGLKNQDKILRILLPIIKQHFSMPLNKHSWAFYSQC